MMLRVADLKLLHGSEEFKVDYVMSRRYDREMVIPQIFIESENDFDGADHEIRKLFR